jgi:hypothetical protein
MTKHRVVGGLVLLVALGTALAGDRQTYRTPQEAFDAARKAIQREDWKGFCATLTDDSRDVLAGGMVMMPLMLKGFVKLAPEDKQKEILAKLKPLEDVMTRHGLTEEALAKMPKDEKLGGKGPDALKQALKKLVAPVKDRSAFVADMIAAMKKLDPKQAKQGPLPVDAELKDVKIDGDTAKGELVIKKDGQEKRDPISFRRIDGSWKIDLPLDLGKRQGKGRPEDPPRIKQ